MDLLQWSANVFRAGTRPGEDKPQMEFRAWLRCLFCGNAVEVKTGQYPLRLREQKTPTGGTFLETTESRVHNGVDQLKQARFCQNCGISSAMPAKDVTRIKQEANRTLTKDWFEAHDKADIPPYIPIKEELRGIDKQVEDFLRELKDLAKQQFQQLADEAREDLKQQLPSLIRLQIKRSVNDLLTE